MQISFDPRDRDSCASVLAVIAALQPEMLADGDTVSVPTPVTEDTETRRAPTPTPVPAPPVDDSDDEPDAATAFGAGNGEPAEAPCAPAAPAEPTASTPAAPSSDVELDADGLPWDARIHSGPDDKRPKNADGRWRRKRGVDDETVEQVTAELRAVMGAPSPTTAAAAETTPPAAEPPAPPAPAASAPTPAPVPAPPTPADAATESGPANAETAASPAPTPAASAAPSANFAELMKKVTARQTAGTLTVADTKAAAEALGLTGVADLLKRPDLIAAFEASLPGGES